MERKTNGVRGNRECACIKGKRGEKSNVINDIALICK